MFKLNKKVEYALMVLKHLHENREDLSTAREIAEKLQIPFETTAKVMQQLHQAQWIVGLKGVKGGYQILIELSDISLVDLVELIEQKPFSSTCENGPCELLGSCSIVGPYKKINEYVERMFRTLPLSLIVNDDQEVDLFKIGMQA